MNGNTLAVPTDVERLIAEIHKVENDAETYSVLAPTDPFYVEPVAERVVNISSLPTDVAQEILDAFAGDVDYRLEPKWFNATYTLSGDEAPHIHDLRLGDRIGVDHALAVRETPNAAIHLREEDVILVSRGLYVPVSSDGTAITFVTPTELARRHREEDAARFAEFLPAAEAARPSWARGGLVFLDEDDDEFVGVCYSTEDFAAGDLDFATIEVTARIDKITKAVTLLEMQPNIELASRPLGSEADAHQLAADLTRFAAALVEVADAFEAQGALE